MSTPVILWGKNHLDIHMARNCARALADKFPGFTWDVECRDGVISVLCQDVSPEYGFCLRQSDLDTDYKVLQRMAGGLLEQYGIPSQRYLPEVMDGLILDFTGRPVRHG